MEDPKIPVLYQHSNEKDWTAILNRIQSHPDEVRVSLAQEKDNGNVSWSQFPIHAAIKIHAPYDVISAFLAAYPESAKCQDEKGMLPLHLAFKNGFLQYDKNEKLERKKIIDMLIRAYPDGTLVKNNQGRIPFACDSFIRHKLTRMLLNNGGPNLPKTKLVRNTPVENCGYSSLCGSPTSVTDVIQEGVSMDGPNAKRKSRRQRGRFLNTFSIRKIFKSNRKKIVKPIHEEKTAVDEKEGTIKVKQDLKASDHLKVKYELNNHDMKGHYRIENREDKECATRENGAEFIPHRDSLQHRLKSEMPQPLGGDLANNTKNISKRNSLIDVEVDSDDSDNDDCSCQSESSLTTNKKISNRHRILSVDEEQPGLETTPSKDQLLFQYVASLMNDEDGINPIIHDDSSVVRYGKDCDPFACLLEKEAECIVPLPCRRVQFIDTLVSEVFECPRIDPKDKTKLFYTNEEYCTFQYDYYVFKNGLDDKGCTVESCFLDTCDILLSFPSAIHETLCAREDLSEEREGLNDEDAKSNKLINFISSAIET